MMQTVVRQTAAVDGKFSHGTDFLIAAAEKRKTETLNEKILFLVTLTFCCG